MKACYKNDLKKAYLILEGVESEAEDYQIYMLKENTIPGLLKTDIRYVDNISQYYYDISGKVSLKAIHEKANLSYEEMKILCMHYFVRLKQFVNLCWRQTAYCWIRNIFIARKRNFISVIFRGVSVN